MTREATQLSTQKSSSAFEAACRVMPGGVNSPVRAFQAVGGGPRFIDKGAGAILTDVDGNDYIDYLGSWGPLILGHTDDRVVAAINKAAARGASFGAPTQQETRLAEIVVARVPSIERVRFVNSGTEATMSAVRVARGFTGRDRIIKFEGCYHGHADSLLVKAGSGTMTFTCPTPRSIRIRTATPGVPSSPGVPAGATADTLVLPYNDPAAVGQALTEHAGRVAAILVEPIAGNMGLIPPVDGYLTGLRELCDEHGALLIFDEVMTGFRVAAGGAQELYDVRPDMTCLGKVLGGGLPMAAYGGRRDIMDCVAPAGPVYQAGTLSGNPLAMAAGVATLQALTDDGVYEQLEERSARLAAGLADAADQAGVAVYQTRVASMLCMFFTDRSVHDFATAGACDTERFGRYFRAMLDRGIYLAPSQFECMFVSLAHTAEQIDTTIAAAAEALREAAK